MRLMSCALICLVACGDFVAAAPLPPDTGPDADATYVVTFDRPGLVQSVASGPYAALKASAAHRTLDVASVPARDLRKAIATERQHVLANAAQRLGRPLEPLHVYDLAFNGLALKLTDREAVDLAAMPGIRRVEPDRMYRLQSDLSAAWLGAPAVWSAPAPFGNKGEGMVVGIVDTGLNRQHPSFAGVGPVDGFVHANPRGQVYGRCLAAPSKCNGKVIGIYDYTDEGLLDGIDHFNHGSLVSSIAVGNTVDVTFAGTLRRISGIAPHASMIVYKACFNATSGNCPLSDVIAAVEQAIEDGVDVVNLSLSYGSSDPWICLESECTQAPWDILNEVMLNLHAAGIVAVTGSSNTGPIPGGVLAPGVSPWMLTVAASRHDRIPQQANELSPFSGRGPAPGGGYLIPDVTAPGEEILGAGAGLAPVVGGGTSMAAPQVAGAAALLRAAHPDWTVADVASVLVTTARPVIVLPGSGAIAGPFEQGAGLVDLSQAVDAGLSLRIDSNGYRAANPYLGGDVEAMNEPALILEKCFRTCTVSRTFTALASGSWTVTADIGGGVTVSASPAQFTLAAGQTREVSFSINAEARVGEWTYGAVRLQRSDASAPDTRLPLAVFGDPGPAPEQIVLQVSSDAGYRDVELPGLVALPDATFATGPLAQVFTRTESLPKGPTANPFQANAGGADGAFAQFVTIPANSGPVTLKVETLPSPAINVQLYAGRDVDADGNTDQSETECASTEPDDRELCEIQIPNRGIDAAYWFIASNREASTPGASDAVTVRWVVLSGPNDDGALTVTGPGHVDSGQPFSVRIAWKDFTLTPGSERESTLLIGSTPAQPGDVAKIPVKLVRSADATTAAAGLVPGVALPVRLLPNESEDRLYLEVPPNASALSVTLSGSGEVNVHAAHAADATGPAIVPAPARADAAASSSAPGANDTLTVTTPQLTPGRWYLTPVNIGTEPAEFTLTAALTYAQARPEPRAGAYYNPARSGSGAFLYPAGNAWAYAVYTYLQDGTPTWYLGTNAIPGANEGTWRVTLERFTWDGAQASGKRIGEGILALRSPTQFQFTWNIDGESGSETYNFLDGGCPAGVDTPVTGIWSAPALPGYGFTVIDYQNVGSIAAYFYDDRGIARWALGADGGGASGTMVMSQFLGAAPLSPYQPPVAEPIGTFERHFTAPSLGQGRLDLELAAPLGGGWNTDHALQRSTAPLGCD